jgi:hypothetical protein
MATCVSWTQVFNSKVYIVRDLFDAMIETLSKDPTVDRDCGIRRKVSTVSPPSTIHAFTSRSHFPFFVRYIPYSSPTSQPP